MKNNTSSVYSDEQENKYFRVEDDSWWFNHRADVILQKMEEFFDKEQLTADVGGGNGFTTSKAKEAGYNMVLVEPSEQACENAIKRGLRAYNKTVSDSFPEEGEWGQILLLDVIEHIEDVDRFMKYIRRAMGKQGMLLVTVPAFMELWSSEDNQAGHYIRYTKETLSDLLTRDGFEVLYSSYFMSFLYYPIYWVRVWGERTGLLKPCWERSEEEERRIMDSQFTVKDGITKRVLQCFQRNELKRIRDKSLKRGSSLIAVARVKKSNLM